MMDKLLLLYGCDESAYRQGVEQLVFWCGQNDLELNPPPRHTVIHRQYHVTPNIHFLSDSSGFTKLYSPLKMNRISTVHQLHTHITTNEK